MSKRKIGDDNVRRKKLKKKRSELYRKTDSSSDTDDCEYFSQNYRRSEDSELIIQTSMESDDSSDSWNNSADRNSMITETDHNFTDQMNNSDSEKSTENFETNSKADIFRENSASSETDLSALTNGTNQGFNVDESFSISTSSDISNANESENLEFGGEKEFDFGCSESDNDTDDDFNSRPNMANDLASWAVKSGTPQEFVNSLLKILHKNDVAKAKKIPKSYVTLVRTPKKKIVQRPMETGNYFTFKSIHDSLVEYEKHLQTDEIIEIDIGVDGFSPFKASALDMWPVMGAVVAKAFLRPFLFGCYAGHKSPKDSDELLKDLCDEVEILNEHGIYFPIAKKYVPFRVRLFCEDAPARAMTCGVMSHSSYEGCPKCKMSERINDGKVIYTSTIGAPRTNETYLSRLYPEHHKPRYQENQCRLESMFKMVDQFPIDPMHCIELGDMKAMIQLLKLKKTGEKIDIEEISRRMTEFRKPNDFSRDCRGLDYLKFFKATELRFFLFYGCVVFMRGAVDDYIYRHVLLLHCAVRLLSDEDMKPEDIDVAEEFIMEYVRLYPIIYGEENVTYNVHVLMHIAYYSRLYGTLDSFSMFKFENFIQMLKGFVRKAQQPLQQLSNRLDEYLRLVQGSEKNTKFNSFQLNPNEKDSFIGIKHNGEIIPARFLRFDDSSGAKCVKVLRCLKIESFYDWPVDSKQLGEISYESLSTKEETFLENEIFFKYCRFPFENVFVLIPILHTSFLKFGDNAT